MKVDWKHILDVLATLLAAFLSLLGVIAVARKFGVSPAALHDPNAAFQPPAMATILAIVLSPIGIVCGVQKLIHRKPVGDLGMRGPLFWALVVGIGSGFAIKVTALLVSYLLSPLASFSVTIAGIDTLTWAPYFLWYAALLLLNSFNEEFVYRAYPLENWRGVLKCPDSILVILAAVIFSLMHFLIEPPEVFHFLYRLAFGVLAGIIYVQRRNIWLVVGLHTGWNFASMSFSDTDWRLGGILTVSGLVRHSEIIANIATLAIAAIAVIIFNRRTSRNS